MPEECTKRLMSADEAPQCTGVVFLQDGKHETGGRGCGDGGGGMRGSR